MRYACNVTFSREGQSIIFAMSCWLQTSSNFLPHSAGGGGIYMECDLFGVTLVCVYHAYPLSDLLSV